MKNGRHTLALQISHQMLWTLELLLRNKLSYIETFGQGGHSNGNIICKYNIVHVDVLDYRAVSVVFVRYVTGSTEKVFHWETVKLKCML